MEWHYELKRRSEGPVSAAKLLELRQAGIVREDTLIWGDSLEGWTKFADCREVIARTAQIEDLGLVPAEEGAGPMAVCAWSGNTYPEAEMLRYGDRWVAPEYKDLFVQSLQEGQSYDPFPGDHETRVTNLDFVTILTQSFSIWKSNFWVIFVATLIVWLPFDLVQYFRPPPVSYEEPGGIAGFFHLLWAPENRSVQMLQNFLTIVSSGAAMSIAHETWRRKPSVTINSALLAGLKNWLRLFGTDLLFGLFAMLLAIPGVLLIVTGHWATIAIGVAYLIVVLGIFCVRNGFSSSIAISEACGGSFALGKSREITRGRFWRVLLFQGIVLGATYGFVFASSFVYFLPYTDNLAVTLIQSMAINLILTFSWVEICVLHRHLEANPAPIKT